MHKLGIRNPGILFMTLKGTYVTYIVRWKRRTVNHSKKSSTSCETRTRSLQIRSLTR